MKKQHNAQVMAKSDVFAIKILRRVEIYDQDREEKEDCKKIKDYAIYRSEHCPFMDE